jgi:hypothetical protein
MQTEKPASLPRSPLKAPPVQNRKEEPKMSIKITAVGLAEVTMFLLSAISLAASVRYGSSTLAFIGLGLVFWGAVLLYIRPEEYTKKVLLEAALSPLLTTVNQLIQELGYTGDATYLPPKFFTNPETTMICVSEYRHASLPTPEQVQLYEGQPIARTPQGLLLTPSGAQLSRLLEKSFGKSFLQTDLENLRRNLPRLFIEDLEIVQNLEIQAQNDMAEEKEYDKAFVNQVKSTTISVMITKPIHRVLFTEADDSQQPTGLIGGPIYSAIAIALAKAAGKPVRIRAVKSSEDGNTVEATYDIVEE